MNTTKKPACNILAIIRRSKSGASMLEYILLIALVVIIGLAALNKFWGKWEDGTGIAGFLKSVVEKIQIGDSNVKTN